LHTTRSGASFDNGDCHKCPGISAFFSADLLDCYIRITEYMLYMRLHEYDLQDFPNPYAHIRILDIFGRVNVFLFRTKVQGDEK
jgi:hypothetical protein